MPKYKVNISRTYIHGTTIEVEADDKSKAEQYALDSIGDHEMSIKTFDEDKDYAEVIEEIPEDYSDHTNLCPKCGAEGEDIGGDILNDIDITLYECSKKKCKTKWEAHTERVCVKKIVVSK